jgi:hypothetical protein
MIQVIRLTFIILTVTVIQSCISKDPAEKLASHIDNTFTQEYSIKYYADPEVKDLLRVHCDRNGYVQVVSGKGLLRPAAGDFLFPGRLVSDKHYRPVSDNKVKSVLIYNAQLVYLDDRSVFSNAWAGRIFIEHNIPDACIFAAGKDFTFLVSDGKKLSLVSDSIKDKEITNVNLIRDIVYDDQNDNFWILTGRGISIYRAEADTTIEIFVSDKLTSICMAGDIAVAGSTEGYYEIDQKTYKVLSELKNRLPHNNITTVAEIKGKLWFGTEKGAFMLREDGGFDYYASLRWLPSDHVTDISAGPGGSVLILTDRGLSELRFSEITLYDKAMYFEKQVRERHIRHGFNATVTGMVNGDYTTGHLEDSDNDGLWTSMYLAGQGFRYAVTHSDEALANIRESLDAMERLYDINDVPGFPSRSFERRGYKYDDKPWRRAADPEWDWKSTTSSDEAIGHIFAFGVLAELVDAPGIREKAVMLIDTLMSHILKNDFYLVDWDGRPTTWGRWNPEYVNSLPEMVGDRKLNSSNITGMLQTAYHFTGKEKYKDAAMRLLTENKYLENLRRPMSSIGKAPDTADSWSRMLSESWNHSDDEMYFCGYWGLYRYAFNDTLKSIYRDAIIDHWEAERPEKDGLWNIMAAITGIPDPDLEPAVWYLQQYPLDLTDWTVTNSHRKDLEFIDPGFREQYSAKVLPPDELRIARHNANRFVPDGGGEGRSEYSAGDIWLLPYWMGRYLGLISAPARQSI